MVSSLEYVRELIQPDFVYLRLNALAHTVVALMGPMVANLADDFSEIGLRMGLSFTLAGISSVTSIV